MNTPVADALAEYRAQLHPAQVTTPRRPRWRWWLVTALTVLVLAGGTWAWLHTHGATPRTPASTHSGLVDLTGGHPSAEATEAPSAQTGSAPQPPLAAPAARWREFATSALVTWLPASASLGPQDADRMAGFAHSREGALFAAANVYPAIYYSRDRAEWRWLADHRVVWAPDARDALRAALDRVWSLSGDGAVLRPVGFRMLSYTPDTSRIRLWWSAESPGDAPVTVGAIATLRWVDDDWSLVFDEPAMDIRTLEPARDSYLPWGPGGEP